MEQTEGDGAEHQAEGLQADPVPQAPQRAPVGSPVSVAVRSAAANRTLWVIVLPACVQVTSRTYA